MATYWLYFFNFTLPKNVQLMSSPQAEEIHPQPKPGLLFVQYSVRRIQRIRLILLAISILLLTSVGWFLYNANYLFAGTGILLLALIAFIYNQSRVFSKELRNTLFEYENESAKRDEFIARISHQIRTPLNNLVALGDLLKDSQSVEQNREFVETLLASTHNMVATVNEITRLTGREVESTGRDIPFNLNSTISTTLELFQEVGNGKVFFFEPSDQLTSSLKGDPVFLKQMVLNILGYVNDRASGKDMKTILSLDIIHETYENVEVLLSIQCIPPLSNLAEERENGNKAFLKHQLDLAQEQAKQHGGSVQIIEDRASTQISLQLLFAKDRNEEGDDAQPSRIRELESKHLSKTNLKQANVLLVEDNPINQRIVKLSLDKHVGSIELAANGKEALDKYGTTRYDIILMDIQMPVMNGLVATRKIREIESSVETHTPIIAITANAMLGDKEKCLEAGMDDYLSKPFQAGSLLEKIQRLLEKE